MNAAHYNTREYCYYNQSQRQQQSHALGGDGGANNRCCSWRALTVCAAAAAAAAARLQTHSRPVCWLGEQKSHRLTRSRELQNVQLSWLVSPRPIVNESFRQRLGSEAATAASATPTKEQLSVVGCADVSSESGLIASRRVTRSRPNRFLISPSDSSPQSIGAFSPAPAQLPQGCCALRIASLISRLRDVVSATISKQQQQQQQRIVWDK